QKLIDLNLIEVTKKGRKNVLSTTDKFNLMFNKKFNFKKKANELADLEKAKESTSISPDTKK
ncbi:MAG: hypothetical protein V1824_00695, partial [archaeon]